MWRSTEEIFHWLTMLQTTAPFRSVHVASAIQSAWTGNSAQLSNSISSTAVEESLGWESAQTAAVVRATVTARIETL